MGLYLVVAYETATSPELRAELTERARSDSEAAFTLLVPATPGRRLLIPRRGQDETIAREMAESAKRQLEGAGLTVVKAVVGEADPLKAMARELQSEAGYASLIICTHPADVSRWLRAGVPSAASRFGLPVTHMVVHSVVSQTRPPLGGPPLMPG